MATTLAQAFLNAGYKPVKPRKERTVKTQKCRKCGAMSMEVIPNTNILMCLNDIQITDKVTGEVRLVACGNKFIFSNFKQES